MTTVIEEAFAVATSAEDKARCAAAVSVAAAAAAAAAAVDDDRVSTALAIHTG